MSETIDVPQKVRELADMLDGRPDVAPGDKHVVARMKALGIVCVYGLSDDLIEVVGASEAEIDAWQGEFREGDAQDLRFLPDGLVDDHSPIDMDDDVGTADEAIVNQPAPEGARIVHVDYGVEDLFWSFRTDIPHATFTTTLHGVPFCRGIVFALADVAGPSTEAGRD